MEHALGGLGIDERAEKIAAAQGEDQAEAGKVAEGFDVFNDQIIDADFLRAVLFLIFKIDVVGGADGNV